MVKSGCYNGELDTTNYGSPMPAIGVYIAFSCLVCFFSIVFDIYYSITRGKLCLPSKLFTPNSFTLTVISVAIKLPVDLNTGMPRVVDQLSKLTSTCFLFIALGLFMSSLGTLRTRECIANMAALTVLVVTVVVNMCIQMFTGVIFAFTVEHLIVLSCTLILLALLWSSTPFVDALKDMWSANLDESYPDEWSIEGMREQIKKLYGVSYSVNPQLYICETPICSSVGVLCAIVSPVLLEAIFAFVFSEVGISASTIQEMRFCKRESDYKWSIWCVVVTQTITILVGSFTLVVRWLIPLSHMSLSMSESLHHTVENMYAFTYGLQKQRFLPLPFEFKSKRLMNILGVTKNSIIELLIGVQKNTILASELVVCSCLAVKKGYKWVVSSCFKICKFNSQNDGGPDHSDSISDEDWDDVSDVFNYLYNDGEFSEWIEKSVVDNLKGWVRESKKEDLTHLIKHLPEFSPPQSAQSLLQDILNFKMDDYNVSCLSVLVLAKFTTFLVPSSSSEPLIQSIKEAFELIHFIDQKMNSRSSYNKVRWILAKDMWLNMGNSNHYVEKKIIAPMLKRLIENNRYQEMMDIDHFWFIVNAFTESFDWGGDIFLHIAHLDFEVIGKCILNKCNTPVVELHECIERTIVELLHLFLSHLPIALLKEYSESSLEDSEERMRTVLKYFCKLEILKDEVSWSWPSETKINKKQKNYLYLKAVESISPLTSGETTVSNEIVRVEGEVATPREHVVVVAPDNSSITEECEITEELGM